MAARPPDTGSTSTVNACAGPAPGSARLEKPSQLYNAGTWRLGLKLSRCLPPSTFANLACGLADLYQLLAPSRFRVVRKNLLPPLGFDQPQAHEAARRLFDQFAIKLTDLWRYESGMPIGHLFHDLTGWEHLLAAQARGRGVLFLTVHLGNWEFGAPLLTERGIRLQVITLAEPGRHLTGLRQQARARWGVDTLALTEDPFASVQIIRRLEQGGSVALLMDRPPPQTATTVELFGQPFQASIAAAELARASGCALLPVCLPRTPAGYVAHLLPEIGYERQTLRDPGARHELTQRIMSAFEAPIRQYIDQWYHFVPVWRTP